MNYKQLTQLGTLIFSVACLSLNGMELSQEKFSLFQDAPITDWSQNASIYDNAYQGAQYDYSCGIAAYERYLARASAEERNVIKDWVYAVQEVEKAILKESFDSWPIETIKQLSAWLTRSSVKDPGALRTDPALWGLRSIDADEKAQIDVLAARKLLAAAPPEKRAHQKNDPLVKANPILLKPLSPTEEEYLQKTAYIFPVDDAIERELITALKTAQEECIRLKTLPWDQRQQRALSLGCKFHYDLVRVHPFTEGAKRLGRLCMFIIHAQNGIRPLGIENALAYTQSLQDGLVASSHEPFEKFFRNTFDRKESQLKALVKGSGKTKSLNTDALKAIFAGGAASQASHKPTPIASLSRCAQCGKEGKELKRCGRCKSVAYCSTDCQTNHWKAGHKSTCPSTESKTQEKK